MPSHKGHRVARILLPYHSLPYNRAITPRPFASYFSLKGLFFTPCAYTQLRSQTRFLRLVLSEKCCKVSVAVSDAGGRGVYRKKTARAGV
jgi:hypothetical protein